MRVCPDVEKRQAKGRLATNWFEEHAKSCKKCQDIMDAVNTLISDSLNNLDHSLDGDETIEHPDTQYSN